MTLTEEQTKELEVVIKAVMKWLNENCHPHTTIIITQTEAELLEGITNVLTNEFIKD